MTKPAAYERGGLDFYGMGSSRSGLAPDDDREIHAP